MTEFAQKCVLKKGDPKALSPIDKLDWFWPVEDRSTWTGPKMDWVDHHQHKWFEHVKKFDLVVQAGGAAGMYPRLLSDKFNIVYTFEPTPLSFHCLVNNCQKDNIIAFQAALGDKPDRVEMENKTEFGMNAIIRQGGNTQQMTLDSLELEACDLLALDVEMYELKVLQGAVNTIRQFSPVIVLELGKRQDIVGFMEDLGYVYVGDSAMDSIYVNPHKS